MLALKIKQGGEKVGRPCTDPKIMTATHRTRQGGNKYSEGRTTKKKNRESNDILKRVRRSDRKNKKDLGGGKKLLPGESGKAIVEMIKAVGQWRRTGNGEN